MKRISHQAFLLGPPVVEGKSYVYALYCPVAKQLRYVGATSLSPLKRYAQHLARSKKPNKNKEAWIEALKALGQKPYMRVLMVFDTFQDALAWEEATIVSFQWRRALCNADKRLFNYSRFAETSATVLYWFKKNIGPVRTTDWPALRPDPIRQRLPASLRQTLRTISQSVTADLGLVQLAQSIEDKSRIMLPDFQRTQAAKLLYDAAASLRLASVLLDSASKI